MNDTNKNAINNYVNLYISNKKYIINYRIELLKNKK